MKEFNLHETKKELKRFFWLAIISIVAVNHLMRWVAYGIKLCLSALYSASSVTIRITEGDIPLKSYKRLCVYSHFDRDKRVTPYVLYAIDAYHRLGCAIIFVTACDRLASQDEARIRPHVSRIIHRRNIGRDFGAFKLALHHIGDLKSFNQLILTNDSTFGPLFDLRDMFDKMATREADMWGVTDSWEHQYHIQTYFIVFNRRAIEQEWFRAFWKSVRFINDRELIIKKYEIGMSQIALKHEARLDCYCRYLDVLSAALEREIGTQTTDRMRRFDYELDLLRRHRVNQTHYFWRDLLVQFRCPFVKIDLLNANPQGVADYWLWAKTIVEHTSYPLDLLLGQLQRLKR